MLALSPFRWHSPSVFLSLLLFACISQAHGQATARADTSSKPAMRAGSWALQFQITSNFSLAAFQGSVISFKLQLADKTALRIGLSSDGYLKTEVKEYKNGSTSSTETSSNRQGLSITAYYLVYRPPVTDANLYYGVGPRVAFSRTAEERPEITSSLLSLSAGVAGVLGAEWFPTRSMSFLAEYGLRFGYSMSNQKTDGIRTRKNTFSFEAESVRFGLSVYF